MVTNSICLRRIRKQMPSRDEHNNRANETAKYNMSARVCVEGFALNQMIRKYYILNLNSCRI
jgi:hypothetical protein